MEKVEKKREGGEGGRGSVRKGVQSNRESDWKDRSTKKDSSPRDDEGVPPTILRDVSILRMLSLSGSPCCQVFFFISSSCN